MTPAIQRRTGVLGLIGFIVLALAGTGAWHILHSSAEPVDSPRQAPPRSVLPGDGDASRSYGEQPEAIRLAPAESDVSPESLVVSWDPARLERYEGKGRLHGTVWTRPSGLSLPHDCLVVLRASRPFPGGRPPDERTLELEPGRRDFSFEDVALGEYELSLQAGGFDSPTLRILLIKPHAVDVSVQLVAHAVGVVEGRVVDADERGVEGLPVVLTSASGGRGCTGTTDAQGAFRFAGVRHGIHRLCLGSGETPLLPPREVHVKAALTSVPGLVLPALGELFVEVVDERGEPARLVPITGWGQPAGSLSVETDSRGCALARFVRPGSYTLLAQGQRGQARQRVEVRAGERAQLRLELSR